MRITPKINDNPVLSNIDALFSLELIERHVNITNNRTLPTADAQALCDAIEKVGICTITGNAP